MLKNFLIILTTLILISCKNNKTEQKEEAPAAEKRTETTVTLTPKQLKNAGIEIGNLQHKNISSTLRVTGQIDVPPRDIVTISVPMGGYLQSTRLLPGVYVSRGQTIAVIQDQQYVQLQQDYLTSKNRMAFLQKEYERLKDLNKGKAVSDKQLQMTESDFKTQLVNERALEEKLRIIGINPNNLTPETITRNLNIHSPIDGYISKVNVNIGKYVNPSDVLFEIVNPNDLHLALNVFEKDLGKLQVGQSVIAYTNSNPDKKYNCKIILISKNVSSDRSLTVHCHFNQYDKALVPGLFMNAEIELNNCKTDVLPQEAVVNYQNQSYIFIAQGNNEFEMVPVQTGATEGTEIEVNIPKSISSGNFVVKGAYWLLMALKNVTED